MNEKVLPPNSARYTAASTPIGMPIADARSSSLPVPTRALAIPPPASPTGLGSLVKKSQLSEVPPCQTRYPRIRPSTETVSSAHAPVRLTITTFRDLRHFIEKG